MRAANRNLLFYFLLTILLAVSAGAQLTEIGINPLRLEAGARPLGMGAAFTGLADDVNSALYNPGGMAWAKGISLTVRDFDNITAVQAYPSGLGSAVGLAISTAKYTNVPITGGTATSSSNLVMISFGSKLTFLPALYRQEAFKRLGIGLNLKGLLGESLRRTGQADRSATAWNMDLGVLWKPTDWWSAGFTTQNFLSNGIKWDQGTPEAVPLQGALAASARLISDLNSPLHAEGRELIVGGEVNFNPFLLRLGGEFGLDKTVFLRMGLMQQSRPAGTITNLNLGLGYRTEGWGMDLVSGRDPVRDEGQIYFSVLYFPREWVVVEKLDFEQPKVSLEKPLESISLEDNVVTYDDRIEVQGKVKPGVEVYVNDLRAATAADNLFKVIIPLKLEKNLVVVEARYEGEKKIWRYKVLRKAKVEVAEEKAVKQELAAAVTPQAKEIIKKKEEEIVQRREKVEELVTLGVIEVAPEAEFKLDASITRGELSSWLAKGSGLALPRITRDLFADVKQDNPLAPFIKLVVDLGLIQPFPDGTFRPDAPVTKEEGDRLFRLLRVQR